MNAEKILNTICDLEVELNEINNIGETYEELCQELKYIYPENFI